MTRKSQKSEGARATGPGFLRGARGAQRVSVKGRPASFVHLFRSAYGYGCPSAYIARENIMANIQLAQQVLDTLTELYENNDPAWDQGNWHDCVAGWTCRLAGREFFNDEDKESTAYERLVAVDSDPDDNVWGVTGENRKRAGVGRTALDLLGIDYSSFGGLWYADKPRALEMLRAIVNDTI